MRDETWKVQLATAEPFLLFYISIPRTWLLKISLLSCHPEPVEGHSLFSSSIRHFQLVGNHIAFAVMPVHWLASALRRRRALTFSLMKK